MVGQAQLKKLHARKTLLVAQADAERQLIALDARRLADSLHWVETIHRGWQHVKPLAWAAVPVAGVYLLRHGRSVWRWASRLVNVWRWVSGLRGARR
jgi:hypothetical protein